MKRVSGSASRLPKDWEGGKGGREGKEGGKEEEREKGKGWREGGREGGRENTLVKQAPDATNLCSY